MRLSRRLQPDAYGGLVELREISDHIKALFSLKA